MNTNAAGDLVNPLDPAVAGNGKGAVTPLTSAPVLAVPRTYLGGRHLKTPIRPAATVQCLREPAPKTIGRSHQGDHRACVIVKAVNWATTAPEGSEMPSTNSGVRPSTSNAARLLPLCPPPGGSSLFNCRGFGPGSFQVRHG